MAAAAARNVAEASEGGAGACISTTATILTTVSYDTDCVADAAMAVHHCSSCGADTVLDTVARGGCRRFPWSTARFRTGEAETGALRRYGTALLRVAYFGYLQNACAIF